MPDGTKCGCDEAYAIQAVELDKMDTQQKRDAFSALISEYPVIASGVSSEEEKMLKLIFGERK